MDKMNIRKAAMIGCGFVGASSAFALMQSGIFSEMVMIDADHAKAEGEAMDLSHGLPFVHPMKIYAGTYADLADCFLIIITAGAGQRPGETRLELVRKNVEIFRDMLALLNRESLIYAFSCKALPCQTGIVNLELVL